MAGLAECARVGDLEERRTLDQDGQIVRIETIRGNVELAAGLRESAEYLGSCGAAHGHDPIRASEQSGLDGTIERPGWGAPAIERIHRPVVAILGQPWQAVATRQPVADEMSREWRGGGHHGVESVGQPGGGPRGRDRPEDVPIRQEQAPREAGPCPRTGSGVVSPGPGAPVAGGRRGDAGEQTRDPDHVDAIEIGE